MQLIYATKLDFMYITHEFTIDGKTLTSCFCYYYSLWASGWAVLEMCLPSINIVALAVFLLLASL